MAKKSITQDLHGTKWKVHQDLADSPGLRFAQEYFSGYDWSRVEWVTVRVGAWGGPGTIYDEELGGWTSPVGGRCQQLRSIHTRGGLYRLNCRMNTRLGWPANKRSRVSPLYRNEDGSWPDVPEGHESGAWLIDPKTGQEWKRLYRLLSLRDQDEALVWIIAHEAFHYLRRTRQVDGKNVEIEADRYAEGVLRAFRVLEEYRG